MTNPWEEISLDDYEKHMSLDSARYIRVYDGAELEMISKSYDKLIIQDITETIDGVHLY